MRYLKQYRGITYTNLLASGRLNSYLADIDRQAQERFERLTEQMKQPKGIMEQLKAGKGASKDIQIMVSPPESGLGLSYLLRHLCPYFYRKIGENQILYFGRLDLSYKIYYK